MNRYQAFGTHFLISLTLVALITLLIFTYWFPGVLSQADTSWQQMLMVIAGVDLVLGPLLTLIVFNPAKKSLKFDLTTIAIIQVGVLIYGAFAMHTTRPVAIFIAMPKIGAEILYADTVQEETLDYIQAQSSQIFYFSALEGESSTAPADSKELRPEQLRATTDSGFALYMKRQGAHKNKNEQFELIVYPEEYPLFLTQLGEPSKDDS